MRVVIAGAGGHAKVIADILGLSGDHEIAGFTDPDGGKHGKMILGHPVLGGDEVIARMAASEPTGVILGIGDLGRRRELLLSLRGVRLDWANAVHPGSMVSGSAKLGRGVAVMAGAVVNPLSVIGDHAIINTNAGIDHDCVIGENVHVAPGVAIGGSVTIGDSALIGIGARIIPGLRVGAGATVGAGAVVVEDVKEGTVVVGVPARAVKGPAG